ncbi:CobW family GTP-binding protein [Aureimonas populi]|uniref:CobW family GTP-binding protein n=1 Tax=Aureimonas populi TaxID=1701758 RepID=A0ABW5CR77_9HYPH|nr:GTP-binding protein [Aureimonas populi]
MTRHDAPIPATLLTGFLGAGKTTLLKRLLDDPQGVRYGVLINDFGAVNIDSELVAESAPGTVSLQNGCVCCTIRSDLVESIEALLARDPAPERLLIEASGVSRPLPLAEALEAPELAGRVRLDGIFCLVDAASFGDLDYAASELALDQATGSDIVVVNKADLTTPAGLDAIEATLRAAAPRLRFLRTCHGGVPRDLLFGAHPAESGHHAHAGGHDHHHHDHGEEFEAWHWESRAPLDERKLRAALRALPPGILRIKGILRVSQEERRAVLHLVGKRFELTEDGRAPPETGVLVAIGRRGAFDAPALAGLLEGCALR